MTDHGLTNLSFVTFNKIESTIASIESFTKNTDSKHVITVVDNASTDGTRDWLREMKSKGVIANIYLLDKNIGAAPAQNIGWAAVDSPWYCKLDNDVICLKSDWLQTLQNYLSKNKEIGAIGHTTGIDNHPDFTLPSGDVLKIVGFCPGPNVLIKNEIHREIGYWCEDYAVTGEDDSDMGLRLSLAGYVNMQVPNTGTLKIQECDKAPKGYNEGKLRDRAKGIENFLFNRFLYRAGLRSLRVKAKHCITPVGNDKYAVRENPEYLKEIMKFQKYRANYKSLEANSEELKKIDELLNLHCDYSKLNPRS